MEAHLAYLDSKIGTLNLEHEKHPGVVLDERNDAADLRDRLPQKLETREVARH